MSKSGPINDQREPTHSVALTANEIIALRETVDWLARDAFGQNPHRNVRWPRWKFAATADSKLFAALPLQLKDELLAVYEGRPQGKGATT